MLIRCPECNKEISDTAKECPNCGYVLKQKIASEGVYCPKCLYCCGKTEIDRCPFCNTKLLPSITGSISEIYDYAKNHPELKKSPNFSYEAYHARLNYKPIDYNTINIPKCPTCGSTNIKKISGTKRWLSTGLFGVASSNIGKSMCCRIADINGSPW